jgi:hypothetical protein
MRPGNKREATMREVRRVAEGAIIWALLAVALAVLIGVGACVQPPSRPAAASAEMVEAPHPELLPGEYRGPEAREVVEILDRYYAGHPE